MAGVALRARISGRVQGVSFRFYTRERARAEGLSGWVRNLADGRVEAWLQGEEAAVHRMEAWLYQGPPAARVSAVDVEPVSCADDLPDFVIRH